MPNVEMWSTTLRVARLESVESRTVPAAFNIHTHKSKSKNKNTNTNGQTHTHARNNIHTNIEKEAHGVR